MGKFPPMRSVACKPLKYAYQRPSTLLGRASAINFLSVCLFVCQMRAL